MIAYVDGSYLPLAEAKVSILDRGLTMGDGVFDTTRTFAGSPFRLDQHLRRLGRSLAYAELDPVTLLPQITAASEEVVRRNAAAIERLGDAWLTQIVTRGQLGEFDFGPAEPARPTVIVMLRPIDFSGWAGLYEEDGVELSSSMLSEHFAGPLDRRVKATSRLAMTRGELKAARATAATGRLTKALFIDGDGTLAEAGGSNLCIVEDGTLVSPLAHQALAGVSLATTAELATGLGMPVRERRLGIYDLVNADEVLITSTSFSVLPVVAVDGIPLPGRGSAYERLLRAWVELVDFDFVAQARERATLQTKKKE